jgi:hypothetical protein
MIISLASTGTRAPMAARISPIILSARIEIIRRDESPNLVEVADGF